MTSINLMHLSRLVGDLALLLGQEKWSEWHLTLCLMGVEGAPQIIRERLGKHFDAAQKELGKTEIPEEVTIGSCLTVRELVEAIEKVLP